MIDALNIATMPIADKVHRHMLASYYALQLDALQAEAKRLGYFFAQADTAATMPPVLAERLAWATEYRRKCYLFPNCPESWERQTSDSMSDGYAQEHCRSMLAALAALGITEVAAVLGGSMGGARALEWALAHPESVRAALVLAVCGKLALDLFLTPDDLFSITPGLLQ